MVYWLYIHRNGTEPLMLILPHEIYMNMLSVLSALKNWYYTYAPKRRSGNALPSYFSLIIFTLAFVIIFIHSIPSSSNSGNLMSLILLSASTITELGILTSLNMVEI